MFAADEDGTNSLAPTTFDICRLEAMEIGDKLDGEYATWLVFRYKNNYTVMFLNAYKICEQMKEFKTLNELISFLNNN